MTENHKTYNATPPKSLEDRIMNSNMAKSESEWWARGKIESLLAENLDLKAAVVVEKKISTANWTALLASEERVKTQADQLARMRLACDSAYNTLRCIEENEFKRYPVVIRELEQALTEPVSGECQHEWTGPGATNCGKCGIFINVSGKEGKTND